MVKASVPTIANNAIATIHSAKVKPFLFSFKRFKTFLILAVIVPAEIPFGISYLFV